MPTNPNGYLITGLEWWTDMFIGVFTALLSLLLILWFTYSVFNTFWGFVIGMDLWFVLVGFGLHFFSVSVPEVSALMAQNYFLQPTEDDAFANMVVYPTGFHPRAPWKKTISYIDLRQVVVDISEDYPAGNGVLIKFVGVILYLPQIRWIPVYIAVSADTIRQATRNIVTGWLSQLIGRRRSAETARQGMATLQAEILAYLEEFRHALARRERRTGRGLTFERRFGVDFTVSALGDVAYDPSYQQTLTSRGKAKILEGVALGLREEEGLKLDPKDAMNAALIIDGDVTKHIIEFEGARDIGSAISKAIVQAAQALAQRQNQAR